MQSPWVSAPIAGPVPERSRLRLDRQFERLEQRGVQGLMPDDVPEYRPALQETGLNRVLLPILQRLA